MVRKVCMGMFASVKSVVCEFMAQFDSTSAATELLSLRMKSSQRTTTLSRCKKRTRKGTNMICYLHCTLRYKDELRVSPSVFDAAQAYEPLLSRSSIVRWSVSVFSPVILMPCYHKVEEKCLISMREMGNKSRQVGWCICVDVGLRWRRLRE